MKEKHDCSKKVYGSNRTFFSSGCSVNAKYFENEQWYCHHHAPSKINERREAERTEWKRQQETTTRINERATERQLAVLRVLEGDLSDWDVKVETRLDPFGYTGSLVLNPKAINQLLIKLGVV